MFAIVKKIMEDHGGNLVLSNNKGGGATIKLLFHQTDDKDIAETKLELM